MSSPPPTLKLDPAAKVAPLAPLALAKLINSSVPQPVQIQIDWEEGVTPTLVSANAHKVEGYANIVRELATQYAQQGFSGKDKDQSAQVRSSFVQCTPFEIRQYANPNQTIIL